MAFYQSSVWIADCRVLSYDIRHRLRCTLYPAHRSIYEIKPLMYIKHLCNVRTQSFLASVNLELSMALVLEVVLN